jgi:thymidylate synthase (FAD)
MTKFRVEVISQTPNPQQTIYAAMHQCYSEEFVWDEREQWPSEEKAGEIITKRLLAGGRGHFGPLENPQIVLNCGNFPHSTMQQITRHRHLTFDVQSGRYTGRRIIAAVDKFYRLLGDSKTYEYDALDQSIGEVFYFRPVGEYTDRQGKKYQYTQKHRLRDLDDCLDSSSKYVERIKQGFSEEQARGNIPFDVRQNWIMAANMRALMHVLTIRGKPDAQLEIQQMCELILPHFQAWAPAVYDWFMANQWKKGRLSP